jgi:hypothetical protein
MQAARRRWAIAIDVFDSRVHRFNAPEAEEKRQSRAELDVGAPVSTKNVTTQEKAT